MKKLLDMLQELAKLETVTADQFSELKALYDAEETKTDDVVSMFSEVEAKLEKEEDESEDKEESQDDETDKSDEGSDEDKGEDKEETPKQFSDPQTGKVYSLDDVRAMDEKLKTIEKLEREKAIDDSLAPFMFSESNKTGLVLPKESDSLKAFAMTLSTEQQKQFFGILD